MSAGYDRSRDKAHSAEVLAHFREINLNRPLHEPSTAELTRDGRFGLRPPNRINDLVRGKFDGHHYDFERIKGQGRGEYRWRLHEPARPGYPKHKNQNVLLLDVPIRTWDDVVRERSAKLAAREKEFQLAT